MIASSKITKLFLFVLCSALIGGLQIGVSHGSGNKALKTSADERRETLSKQRRARFLNQFVEEKEEGADKVQIGVSHGSGNKALKTSVDERRETLGKMSRARFLNQLNQEKEKEDGGNDIFCTSELGKEWIDFDEDSSSVEKFFETVPRKKEEHADIVNNFVEDSSSEEPRAAADKISTNFQSVTQDLYSQQGAQGTPPPTGGEASGQDAPKKEKDENVVDADFEVVDEDKNNAND